jgi:hypothetical protein
LVAVLFAGVGLYLGASNLTLPSLSQSAAASTRSEIKQAQPVRGPVPHAHTVHKIVKADEPIGEIFDRVYELGSLTTNPLRDVQTITVPPGGASMVEFKVQVPGKFMLVDHALSRVERGLVGILEVTGPDNPVAFKDYDPAKSAHSMSH